MATSARVAVVATLITVDTLVASATQVAGPRGPLASRQVLGGPIAILDLPATDTRAFNARQPAPPGFGHLRQVAGIEVDV